MKKRANSLLLSREKHVGVRFFEAPFRVRENYVFYMLCEPLQGFPGDQIFYLLFAPLLDFRGDHVLHPALSSN